VTGNATFTDLGEGRYALRGSLRFETVPALWADTRGRFGGGDRLTVDLGGVTEVDSAGLALMIEWLRETRRAGGELRLDRIPQQMQAIARVSRLSGLLSSGSA
jgi:phospholipid transport system transporter-binding protein